ILADDKTDARVRAWAGWALSRMTYPGIGGMPNLELISWELGQAAVVAGEKIVTVPISTKTPTKNLKMVALWSEPLVRVLDALTGELDLRGSGLNTMASGGAALRGVEQRIRALATASAQLSQAAGAQVTPAKQTVVSAVAELKSYLEANPPKKLELY